MGENKWISKKQGKSLSGQVVSYVLPVLNWPIQGPSTVPLMVQAPSALVISFVFLDPLDKIEGRRRRGQRGWDVGWHHWLNGNEFKKTLGVCWHAAIHGVTKSRTQFSDWTTTPGSSHAWSTPWLCATYRFLSFLHLYELNYFYSIDKCHSHVCTLTGLVQTSSQPYTPNGPPANSCFLFSSCGWCFHQGCSTGSCRACSIKISKQQLHDWSVPSAQTGEGGGGSHDQMWFVEQLPVQGWQLIKSPMHLVIN